MRIVRSYCIALFAVMLVLISLTNGNTAIAADIKDVRIETSYVYAGYNTSIQWNLDRAGTTGTVLNIEYSFNNSDIWKPLHHEEVEKSLSSHFMAGNTFFAFPAAETDKSVKLRVHAEFNPIVGSNNVRDFIVGPYTILHPQEPTDFTATANKDGSVTLTWTDNSDTESSYQIERVGSDGTKTFTVPGTMEHFGPLQYVDNTTIKTKDTFYIYKLQPIVDRYTLPDIFGPYWYPAAVITHTPTIADKVGTVDKLKLQVADKVTDRIGSIIKKDAQWTPTGKIKLPIPEEAIEVIGKGTDQGKDPDIFVGASEWALPELKQAFAYGLTTGNVMNRYTQAITREEFAGLAVKLYETLSGNQATTIVPNPFNDTSSSDVLKAYHLGIAGGVNKSSFAPSATITRQEMCVMLMRTIQAALPSAALDTSDKTTFADSTSISDWARTGVNFAVNYNLIQGDDGNRMVPLGNTTREQAIVLSKRAFESFYAPAYNNK